MKRERKEAGGRVGEFYPAAASHTGIRQLPRLSGFVRGLGCAWWGGGRSASHLPAQPSPATPKTSGETSPGLQSRTPSPGRVVWWVRRVWTGPESQRHFAVAQNYAATCLLQVVGNASGAAARIKPGRTSKHHRDPWQSQNSRFQSAQSSSKQQHVVARFSSAARSLVAVQSSILILVSL